MDCKDINLNLNYYSDYFEALFFVDVENSDNEDIDSYLSFSDINKECLVKQFEQLDSFFQQADYILEHTEYNHKQACHDFFMTRQGHGVGFWENDHCNKLQGTLLTQIAESFGEVYIYQGDNDELYIE